MFPEKIPVYDKISLKKKKKEIKTEPIAVCI